MKIHFEKLKEEIPEEYHFLLHGRLCDTDTLREDHRTKEMNRASFNECEQCGYNLLSSEAYKGTTRELERHPINGFVRYIHYYRKALCDKCIDQLNGQPWK